MDRHEDGGELKLCDLNIKLIDFGFANIVENHEDLDDFIGTPYYMAPEIIDKNKYGSKVDIWSLGILTYFIIDGSYPY
jgi:p21-activated kinase 1